mmetsp:Transcript_4224/g.9523  ORF Transcript_4224/g.9523 Transcript_4224/m.9523 type:complete len:97 (-) Transcript_4224:271-561(-)
MVSEKWVDGVEEKPKNVKEQRDFLGKCVAGAKRKSVGSGEDQKYQPDPLSLLHCPITGDMMVDPVVAADGYTYGRSAIEDSRFVCQDPELWCREFS